MINERMTIFLIAFVCIFGGTFPGIFMRSRLPQRVWAVMLPDGDRIDRNHRRARPWVADRLGEQRPSAVSPGLPYAGKTSRDLGVVTIVGFGIAGADNPASVVGASGATIRDGRLKPSQAE